MVYVLFRMKYECGSLIDKTNANIAMVLQTLCTIRNFIYPCTLAQN